MFIDKKQFFSFLLMVDQLSDSLNILKSIFFLVICVKYEKVFTDDYSLICFTFFVLSRTSMTTILFSFLIDDERL